jgi:hypothetical protein
MKQVPAPLLQHESVIAALPTALFEIEENGMATGPKPAVSLGQRCWRRFNRQAEMNWDAASFPRDPRARQHPQAVVHARRGRLMLFVWCQPNFSAVVVGKRCR